ATHDTLTGAFNRLGLRDAKRFAVMAVMLQRSASSHACGSAIGMQRLAASTAARPIPQRGPS
ncbi:MAG TPA: hypothetical protein PKZ77_04855, partial [Pseudomonadales bacterium]|nr:hypothetical protein [Pseudomonadales bacterium]